MTPEYCRRDVAALCLHFEKQTPSTTHQHYTVTTVHEFSRIVFTIFNVAEVTSFAISARGSYGQEGRSETTNLGSPCHEYQRRFRATALLLDMWLHETREAAQNLCAWRLLVSYSTMLRVTLQFRAPEQRDTAKDVLLFLVQHSGIHSHCLFMIHH